MSDIILYQRKFTKLFKSYIKHRLPKDEDQEDFMQECWLELLQLNKTDVCGMLIAKMAIKSVLRKQYLVSHKTRYETNAERVDGAQKFDDATSFCLPGNPNDRLAQKPYVLRVNGGPKLYLDQYDVSELLGISITSIKTTRSRGRDIIIWFHEGQFYRTLEEVRLITRTRLATARARAQKIVLSWVR